jgi:hypothetical protein
MIVLCAGRDEINPFDGVEAGGVDFVHSKYFIGFLEKCDLGQ